MEKFFKGVGCGALLPLTGFYTQVGSLESFPWLVWVPLFLIFYAGNIITALPDYQSDLAGNKRTYPVRLGQRRSRGHILALLFCAFILISWVTPNLTKPFSLFALAQAPSLLILLIVKRKGWLERGDIEKYLRMPKICFMDNPQSRLVVSRLDHLTFFGDRILIICIYNDVQHNYLKV